MSARRWQRIEAILVFALLLAGGLFRLRVVNGWQFGGFDSYAYVKLADELAHEHRFALGPEPEPLRWYRRPLYPALIALVKGDARLDPDGGEGWRRITRTQVMFDLYLMCPLVWLVARRLAGRFAGLCALALAALWPTSVFYDGAVLTESLAMTLTMLALAPLFLVENRRIAFALAGVGIGLSALLRPEGPLLVVALVPALIVLRPWKKALALGGICALAFLLAFAWWPARNVACFGRMHLSDGMVDRYSREVEHWAGFWRWLSTWARDDAPYAFPQDCFYYLVCRPTPEKLDTGGAYETVEERDEVARLLVLREKTGLSKPLSDGFMKLARRRLARHPLRVLVGLPLSRALSMWTRPQDELLQNPKWVPWPAFTERLRPGLRALSILLFAATVLAAIALVATRRTRVGALVLVAPIAARTLALAYSGFSLPRYSIPIYPLSFVLAGAALGLVWARRKATSPS